jgi:HlyD family secretion protein
MNKRIVRQTVMISGLGLLLTACQPSEPDPGLTGYIEAELRFIAAPQAGLISQLEVREGDPVSSGQLLFQLDQTEQLALTEQAGQNLRQAEAGLSDQQKGARPAELAALTSQLQEAQARLQLATSELKRISSLEDKGLTTGEQLDRAETDLAVSQAQVSTIRHNIEVAGLSGRIDQLLAAEAAVKAAAAQLAVQQHRLAERTVKADMHGVVDELFFHPGEYVTPATPVLAIRLTGQDKVRFHVSQAELPALSLGQTIQVMADGSAQAVEATISYISSTAEFTPPVIYSKDSRSKLVFLIEARLVPGSQLPPGLPVDVRL